MGYVEVFVVLVISYRTCFCLGIVSPILYAICRGVPVAEKSFAGRESRRCSLVHVFRSPSLFPSHELAYMLFFFSAHCSSWYIYFPVLKSG